MAKFQLNPGETMIGSGMMSLYQKSGLTKKPFQGTIYVTNQRACFQISMSPHLDMDLPIEEIKGFTVKKLMLVTQVTIHSKSGETYPLTGFPAKKLQGWLQQVGVQQM